QHDELGKSWQHRPNQLAKTAAPGSHPKNYFGSAPCIQKEKSEFLFDNKIEAEILESSPNPSIHKF
ncbi:hypothetical protein ABFV57_34580, partial [Pseudomonas neuropathica]|uniref:hypothetical protein n=1 Tax=Pseudomonas neuropathica TaxID=2730425 RepID=UPI0034D3A522